MMVRSPSVTVLRASTVTGMPSMASAAWSGDAASRLARMRKMYGGRMTGKRRVECGRLESEGGKSGHKRGTHLLTSRPRAPLRAHNKGAFDAPQVGAHSFALCCVPFEISGFVDGQKPKLRERDVSDDGKRVIGGTVFICETGDFESCVITAGQPAFSGG